MNTAYRSIFYTKRALLGLYDCLKFESIKIFRHADGFSLRPCGNNVTGNFIKIDNIDFHVIFICIYEKLDSKMCTGKIRTHATGLSRYRQMFLMTWM